MDQQIAYCIRQLEDGTAAQDGTAQERQKAAGRLAGEWKKLLNELEALQRKKIALKQLWAITGEKAA